VALAVATGVSMDVWARWGVRAIATAEELLEQTQERAGGRDETGGYEGPQMSG